MPTLTERLAIIITGESKSGEAAFKQVGAASKQAASQMGLAQRAVGNFTSSLSQFASSPTAIIGASAAAGAAALGFAEHVVNEFADATSAVRAFQRVSGATAEDSSRLVAASKVLGVDADKLGTAMFRLAHNLDGNKDALAKYGVEVAHTKSGAVDLTGTLLNVADAVHRVGPGAEADAIAFAAFGRQAAALLPILLRGRDGLQELFKAAAAHHEIFSQADLEAGRQFSLAMKEFKSSLAGLELEAGKELIPTATLLAHWAENVTNAANKAATGLNIVVRGPLSTVGVVSHKILGGSKKDHEDLAQAAVHTADELDKEAKAADADAKAVDAYNKATNDATKAHDTLDKAHRSVATAQREESNARKDLNDLQAKGAVDAAAVADAEKGVASAAKATADAQKGEAEAAQRVVDAQQGVLDAQVALQKVAEGASPAEIERATLAHDKALRDQKRAALGVADAEDKKNSIIDIGVIGVGQSVGTAREKEQAELDLADALDGVKSADLDAQDAQKVLDDTRNKGKAGSDDLKKAQDDLKGKQDDLNAAIQGQADAHENVITKQGEQIKAGDDLKKAQEGDPDFADKLRDAQQKVADAHQNTADQITAEKDALDDLVEAQKRWAAAQEAASTSGVNVQTSAIGAQDFRPVSRPLGTTGAPPAGITGNTFVTIHTAADPNAVQRAINQNAARNGGKPRGGPDGG